MDVLSLFDGISCGRVALERAGIPVGKYYASEIDKYAIKISTKNYPDIIRLGDITVWKDWHIPKPDLIIAGSPCQGFSFAGKGLNFDDPRSKLFFVFADILKHYHPKFFLLENVVMSAQSNDVISSMLGELYPECVEQPQMFKTGRLEPIMINSALISAQNRERLYWTNIPGITQPEDKGILLRNIIEDGEVDRHKSLCLDANYYKGGSEKNYKEKKRRQLVMSQSENRLMVRCQQIAQIKKGGQGNRIYNVNGKAPTLTAICGGHQEPKISEDNITWRKLTCLECERLQTLPNRYTEGVSNTRRYHALGNGWTVDVVAHIFKFILKAQG